MRARHVKLIGSALAIVFAGAMAASAGTPLDPTGEVTGFVPPVRNFAKCERWVSKRAGLAGMCILQCHKKKVALAYRNLEFDVDACETVCRDKYQQHVDILKPGLCPPCLDEAHRTALYSPYKSVAEQVTGLFYCDAGAPIGSGHPGFVPTLDNVIACEQKIGLNAIKVIKCIKLVCHRKLADSLANRDASFNEEDCRRTDAVNSCLARYTTANQSLKGCPACIDDASERQAVFDLIEGVLDSANGLSYCASPSGAFLD
jgi:hypothetical protein